MTSPWSHPPLHANCIPCLTAENTKLQKRVAELEAAGTRAQGVLRELEWIDRYNGVDHCPICQGAGEGDGDRLSGHVDGCRLAIALAQRGEGT
jgi:hypothetical protein